MISEGSAPGHLVPCTLGEHHSESLWMKGEAGGGEMRETHQGKARYNTEVRLPTMKLGSSSQGFLFYSLSFWWKASIQHTGNISYMSHDILIAFLLLLPRCSMTSWSLRYSDGPVTTSVIRRNWGVAFRGRLDRLFLHTFLFSGFSYILYHPATLFFCCLSEHSKFIFTSQFLVSYIWLERNLFKMLQCFCTLVYVLWCFEIWFVCGPSHSCIQTASFQLPSLK